MCFWRHSETGRQENNFSEFWQEHISSKIKNWIFTLQSTVTYQYTGAAASCVGTEPNQIISGTNIQTAHNSKQAKTHLYFPPGPSSTRQY